MTRNEETATLGQTSLHDDDRYPLSELTSRIIACAIEVHKTLGPGFEEVFYQRALHRELAAAGLDSTREVDIEVHYKDLVLGKKRVDFVVEGCLVEIKARAALEDVDKIQTLSYLKASGFPVALLINFGAAQVEIKRLANTKGSLNR
ncbi:MAG: GxxExxY protein [Armatimonadota bacterium]|nr:GxxExxY protein [Armatimonadota bacterium]